MVICLERGADLHIAQLMPLPLTVSSSVKSRLVLPFWYQLTRVVANKGPLNRYVCVCTYLCSVPDDRGGWQANVERCKVRLNCPEPDVTWLASWRFQFLGNKTKLALRARLCSMDQSAHAVWPKNLRRLIQKLRASGGQSVGGGSLRWKWGTVREYVVCDTYTTG